MGESAIVINGSLIPERLVHFNGYVSASVMGHCNGIVIATDEYSR